MDRDMEDVDQRAAWLQVEQSSAVVDVFGEPQKTTRIGDEYQAQIPSLMTENQHLQLIELPDAQNKFRFGLSSIPPIWVDNQHKNTNADSAESESGILGSEMDSGLLSVPDSASESWSVIEHDRFLLGLYIFGKNLRVVNEFMGNKGMKHVLSYYYGKFCKSGEHQKWSTYRKKKRSRKSIPGKKIFKGWRLQELLSRLLPNVTDECKTILTQVTRTFEEGNLSFEKYVFALRDAVGIDLLEEAVAIGKRKRDLTIKKPSKNNKFHSPCSSMKTEEIVNILKDRIGLRKGWLNDLFWEAVWPRLLARGWHSEQPRNCAFQNSKNSLVFLAPGVAKYSRRSLEKGSQYFDSLTEVLNKVASEPQLLEYKPEQQDILVESHGSDDDDKQDFIKCTIYDTSLVGVYKIKELTRLPVSKRADMEASCSFSVETEQDPTEEESQNEDVNCVVNSPNCEETSGVNPDHPVLVSRIEDDKTDISSTNGTPKAKHRRVNNARNDNTSGQDEAMNLNNHRVSDGDNSLSDTKPSSGSSFSGNGQRQSRRNRPLTTKALEAFANGFLDPKKKRRGSEEGGARRCVRAKTTLVSSCGAPCIENQVDGVFSGPSHMVSESPK